MTVFVFANNASTTLAGPIATSATSLSLAAGTGGLFPNPGVGQQFSMTLVSQTDSNVREIVYCTARNIDTCTVIRGQENTSPAAFIAGDAVNNWLTAGQMAAMTQSTQLQQQTGNYAIDTGTANNIIIALNPAPASLAQLTGAPLRIKVAAQNGGTTTLTVNTLSATVVQNIDGTNLNPQQVLAGGIAEIVYNGSVFQLLTFDPLASANTWGQTQTFPNIVSSIGTVGGVVFSGAGQVTSNNIVSGIGSIGTVVMPGNGSLSAPGNITSTTAKLRAYEGAFNSGDPNCATILQDFVISANSLAGVLQLPNGYLIQTNTIVNTTGADFINFPVPFVNACFNVIACEGAPTGWSNGAFPTIFGTQQYSLTNFALYVSAWTGTGWALKGSVTTRFVAFGY